MNPFKEMMTPKQEMQGTEMGGTFFCQERGCYNVCLEAIYIEAVQTLTWKCKDEHISYIEGFSIG